MRKLATVLLISCAGSLALPGCSTGAPGDEAGVVGASAASSSSAPAATATGRPAAGDGAGTRDGDASRGDGEARDDAAAGSADGDGGDGAGETGDGAAEPAEPAAAGRTTTDAGLDAGPVAVDDEPEGDGLTVELASIGRTEATPSMPGEIGGPAIRVEVTVNNAGDANHDLGASVVNLYYGPDRDPASLLSGSGEKDLPDSVAAGERVNGTYVFSVPEGRIGRVIVEIDVDPELHVALFKGEVGR
ncbi:hypothetical protein [Myceligenerans crystallogenes]|uniref:DUF4352 domain-containing protein n=1 Tax=Myceligenerans crystallogenes TaxID=316335 RepID=A0ABP4ZCE7_9MICO